MITVNLGKAKDAQAEANADWILSAEKRKAEIAAIRASANKKKSKKVGS